MRILFLSDTHLGFDLPFKPRIQRRRRGPDFFQMLKTALLSAFQNKVDAVVHGGDFFYRSKIPASLVQMAFEPFHLLAEKGVPIYIVPGNHERSHIPFPLLATHPNIHIFRRPKTFYLEKNGFRLALAGFPFIRENVRLNFSRLWDETGWKNEPCDARLLCIHHCVDGSAIKQGERVHIFRNHKDVIKIEDLQIPVAAVLSGHIHRAQVIRTDLAGHPIPVHVFYSGSVERTSFEEKDEPKGYLTMDVQKGSREFPGGRISHWQFHPLPARPMIQIAMENKPSTGSQMSQWIQEQLLKIDPNSVVQLRISGKMGDDCLKVLTADSIRKLAPQTMNVSVVLPDMNRKKIVKTHSQVT